MPSYSKGDVIRKLRQAELLSETMAWHVNGRSPTPRPKSKQKTPASFPLRAMITPDERHHQLHPPARPFPLLPAGRNRLT